MPKSYALDRVQSKQSESPIALEAGGAVRPGDV
jgi:hypothetical protein